LAQRAMARSRLNSIRLDRLRFAEGAADAGMLFWFPLDGKICFVKVDGLIKSRQIAFSVIPAEAGIESLQAVLVPGVRRGDDLKDFLRVHQS
jgi:hypothetical protein